MSLLHGTIYTYQVETPSPRLDKFLHTRHDDMSRSHMQHLIRGGHVKINALVTQDPACKLRPGDEIIVTIPEPVTATPEPQKIILDILYEDHWLLVINKPAGLVVHPGAGNKDHTLVNALLYHCGPSLSGINGVARPGIVHRLDKDTSGLIVVAKNDQAHQRLASQFATRSLRREYHALVHGCPFPPKGTVNEPIGRDRKNRQKMAVYLPEDPHGKAARTDYETLNCFGTEAALISCRLHSGRTHQIRVHMAHLGHPVIGDQKYQSRRFFGGDRLDFPRQALHATTLQFLHPHEEKPLKFTTSLPYDMEQLRLRLETGKNPL